MSLLSNAVVLDLETEERLESVGFEVYGGRLTVFIDSSEPDSEESGGTGAVSPQKGRISYLREVQKVESGPSDGEKAESEEISQNPDEKLT